LGFSRYPVAKIWYDVITLNEVLMPYTQEITKNGMTPEQEEMIMNESKETIRDFRAGKLEGYTSTEELFKDLLVLSKRDKEVLNIAKDIFDRYQEDFESLANR
jgi:hypothetical protein